MKSAFIEISDLLEDAGLSTDEIDALLGRFLEEEAFEYVNAMNEVAMHMMQKDRKIKQEDQNKKLA